MARRNNKKISNAHHESMLNDEMGRIQKKKRKATRRAEKKQRERLEAVLCDALTNVAVGEETKNALPKIGAPITTDVVMKPAKVKKVGRKKKKETRRVQKIRERQANRSAMTM